MVIDALDSVNARYSINRACSKQKIPFVTGAAVGVSGQVFTVMPGESACYHCISMEHVGIESSSSAGNIQW